MAARPGPRNSRSGNSSRTEADGHLLTHHPPRRTGRAMSWGPCPKCAFIACWWDHARILRSPDRDHRQPHPDLADIFSGPQSCYLYQMDGLLAGMLDYFGDEFAEEYEEVEFLIGEEEPRTLVEIVDAMEEFFDRVWYVRSIVHADAEDEEVPEDIRAGARAARQWVEDTYGRDSLRKPIGPGHDEAWQYGYISGKLAALRWVLGSEWDFLDT
jgi:hypothetical protein